MESSYEGGRWGQNIALYIIAGVILVALFIWLCHRSGEDKANLSASVQNLYGRLSTLEPVVASNTATLVKIGNTLSASVQGIADIKADIDALDGAVFVSSCGCSRRSHCGEDKFRKETTYTLGTTTLTEIDTCNN